MRIGLVSGDGLPVSGLLTVFRNVLDLGRELGVVDGPVPADLGYSWRPDKKRFFPAGSPGAVVPPWLTVAANPAVAHLDPIWLAAEIDEIRRAVVRFDTLESSVRDTVLARSAALEKLYTEHFAGWFAQHRPDWVFALNTTLSDAVFVTSALYSAAAEYYRERPGGLVIWDHDLFGSCAVWDADAGQRHYPGAPNAATPVPPDAEHIRWIVVSEALAREAAGYGTELIPRVAPNILPAVPDSIEIRHREAAAQLGLDLDRPILLDPVRVFRVKGVDVALRFHHAVIARCVRRRHPIPYLLIFGSLDEDPDYATEVRMLAEDLGIGSHVRFLDGVPLGTTRDRTGRWHLDEIDLLRLARVTGGGVLFTPSVPDVETVGLGPALAACARIPCAATEYAAFAEFYGTTFTCARFATTGADLAAAADMFVDLLVRSAHADSSCTTALHANALLVEDRFSRRAWQDILLDLARRIR
ncbi:hypothetical protein ACFXHA_33030 [Nocardia sp. NPDC059240]|uniref:hypothetical protein n=1 Tax=Nocardia sp. NPDC059240 TaxID=3346786 RepID=UPI0036C91B32